MNEAAQKTVVVVGGGFAGLNVARSLSNEPGVKVILIDQRNHHLFQPLLYQVATAGLNPADIASPIRSQFTGSRNVSIHWAGVTKVDLDQKKITVDQSVLDYDYLVLACGAQHSYFGHPEWEQFAPGLKTLEQATEMRRRILSAFEHAENETDPDAQKALLTFTVVGGGPTGVELAGAIADISRTVIKNDFDRIDPTKARIILVEAGKKILAPFADELSQRAVFDLKDLGVEVMIGAPVKNITELGVQVGEEFISSRTVFWAAGVQAAKMSFSPEVEHDKAGRILVGSDLAIKGYPHTFVAGDMASVKWGADKTLPGLAPVAMQQGRYLARTILGELKQKPRTPFSYLDKGQMATIGKSRAIMEFKDLRIGGFYAWIAWLFIHIFYLIGFKNRVAVMGSWVWSYVFSKRGARLITNRDWKLIP